jgi:S1-C subfamily serine protease
VVRPWLGIYGTTLNDTLARRYQLPSDSGVLVVEVDPRGPAYESGLRVGDVLTAIGSQEIKQIRDILSARAKHTTQEEVSIGFIRGGTRRSTQLRLREPPMPVIVRR